MLSEDSGPRLLEEAFDAQPAFGVASRIGAVRAQLSPTERPLVQSGGSLEGNTVSGMPSLEELLDRMCRVNRVLFETLRRQRDPTRRRTVEHAQIDDMARFRTPQTALDTETLDTYRETSPECTLPVDTSPHPQQQCALVPILNLPEATQDGQETTRRAALEGNTPIATSDLSSSAMFDRLYRVNSMLLESPRRRRRNSFKLRTHEPESNLIDTTVFVRVACED